MPKLSTASISMTSEQTRLLAETNSFKESGGVFVDQKGVEHPYAAENIWYDDFNAIVTASEAPALFELSTAGYVIDFQQADTAPGAEWSHIEIESTREETALLADYQKDVIAALIAALHQTASGRRMMAVSCAHDVNGNLLRSISLHQYAVNHESKTVSFPLDINANGFAAEALARINTRLLEHSLLECTLAGNENSGHALTVPVESNAAERAAPEAPVSHIRTAGVPDVAQIEAQIQKLREAANRRASSLTDFQSSQAAISEREQAVRAKESAEAERDEAISAKQQLLQQAKHEDSLREELQEKIEALSEQIETLHAHIKELNAAIAKKDQLIAALTTEKLQLNETVKIAENNTSKALETSRAWQSAATEEINAHAVTVADRDSLLTGIEQLDLEVKRHAAAFHKELYELEQATRAQIENLTKELQYQSQQAVSFIKALSIQNQASQQLIDGFKRQLPLQTEQQDEATVTRAIAAEAPVIALYDRTVIGADAPDAVEAPSQTDSGNERPYFARTDPGTALNGEPVPDEQTPDKSTASHAGDLPASCIAATIPSTETEALAAPAVINGNALPFPRKLRRLSQLPVQHRKNHQLVWQNIKNDFGKVTSEGEEKLDNAIHYHLQKQAAKDWQNKIGTAASSRNGGSAQWYRQPDESQDLSSRAERLESNVRQLTEFSMTQADNAAAATSVTDTLSTASNHAVYTKNSIDNHSGRRMRAVIAAGLSTLSVNVLIVGLAMYAATDGDGTTPMHSITGQLHRFQSEAAHFTAKADQLLRRKPSDNSQETMNPVDTDGRLPGSEANTKDVNKAQEQTLGLTMPQTNNQDIEVFTFDDKKNTPAIPDVQQIMNVVFEFDSGAVTGTFLKPYFTEELTITAKDKPDANTNTPNATQVAAIFPR